MKNLGNHKTAFVNWLTKILRYTKEILTSYLMINLPRTYEERKIILGIFLRFHKSGPWWTAICYLAMLGYGCQSNIFPRSRCRPVLPWQAGQRNQVQNDVTGQMATAQPVSPDCSETSVSPALPPVTITGRPQRHADQSSQPAISSSTQTPAGGHCYRPVPLLLVAAAPLYCRCCSVLLPLRLRSGWHFALCSSSFCCTSV